MMLARGNLVQPILTSANLRSLIHAPSNTSGTSRATTRWHPAVPASNAPTATSPRASATPYWALLGLSPSKPVDFAGFMTALGYNPTTPLSTP